jgi:hypothetical protein
MAYTTINKSLDYFNTKLYTGDGTTSHAITGVGFEPSMVWCKNRDGTNSHFITDQVRGATKVIHTDTSQAEGTWTNGLISFDSDGFTQSNSGAGNENGQGIASWNWKAGTAVSGNTGGSGTAKTYTGSVNTTAGFSIIKYIGNGSAGHTIPHHLGTANIGSIFVKNLDSGSDYWYSYHKPLGATKTLILNETDAVGTNTMWNNTAPTSSVFSVGSNSGSNTNNQNYISYIFSDVQGYCKTGKYLGNGNADGNFIYTGFKPAFFLAKRITNGTEAWVMFDNKRENSFNGVTGILKPNLNEAETTQGAGPSMDFLSNGIKFRNTDGTFNNSGIEFIYMAFAEAPLVGTNGVTAKAR